MQKLFLQMRILSNAWAQPQMDFIVPHIFIIHFSSEVATKHMNWLLHQTGRVNVLIDLKYQCDKSKGWKLLMITISHPPISKRGRNKIAQTDTNTQIAMQPLCMRSDRQWPDELCCVSEEQTSRLLSFTDPASCSVGNKVRYKKQQKYLHAHEYFPLTVAILRVSRTHRNTHHSLETT